VMKSVIKENGGDMMRLEVWLKRYGTHFTLSSCTTPTSSSSSSSMFSLDLCLIC
jgi:hypothetical protein